jgi:DNA-binding SARP family transcriptional activator
VCTRPARGRCRPKYAARPALPGRSASCHICGDPVEFQVLGPLRVTSDDGPIEIDRLSWRELLTVLLVHAARPVSTDRLIDALWGGAPKPPDNPERALRSRIFGVRHLVGERLQRQQPRPGGYQLRVMPGELDADTFRSLAADGLVALEGGDPAGAARLLQQAEDLWTEPPPWPDWPNSAVMRRAASSLAERRREIRDALVDARLALGHHQAVIVPLLETISSGPVSERVWVQLMLAQYRSGDKSGALNSYTRARAAIASELGVDPGPELGLLYTQILADDPALALEPRSAVARTAAPQASWSALYQLPPAPADFTGRSAEIDTLTRRLRDGRMTITVITGPAGVGKSTLALHAAHLVYESFPDGQLYVHLGGPEQRREPQDALAEMLRALGVPRVPAAGAEREALYRSLLSHRRVLLVADDAVAATQVRPLLPGTDGSAVLVTSRGRLPDLETAQVLELAELPAEDAVTLLHAVAGPDGGTGEPEAFTKIAACCGGLPLALRIAGARLASEPSLTPGSLARGLARGHQLAQLEIGDMSVERRLATAYTGLGPRDQLAFQLLALHSSGDIPGWLVPVLLADSAAHGAAAAMARSGLLTEVPAPGEASCRYQMHCLTRVYAAHCLTMERPAEAAAAGERLVTAWLELADHASRLLPQHAYLPPPATVPAGTVPAAEYPAGRRAALAWFARYGSTLTELAVATCAKGKRARAIDLADRLFAAQCQLEAFEDGCGVWEAIVSEANTARDALSEARARYRLTAMTMARYGRGTPGDARLLARCGPTFYLHRDMKAVADTCYLLALCAAADDNPTAALQNAEDGIKAARAADYPRGICLNLSVRGIILGGLGSADEATACCDEAMTIATDMGDPAYEELVRHARAEAGTLILTGDFYPLWGLRSQASGTHGPAPA